MVTISGSNLGQKPEDVENSVTVAGVPCHVIPSRYEVSSRQGTHATRRKSASPSGPLIDIYIEIGTLLTD